MRLPAGRVWTERELEFLRDSYRSCSVVEIAAKLHRTEQAVRNKAFQLDLGRCQAMTLDDIELLKRLQARQLSAQRIAKLMRRSTPYIRRKCAELDLRTKTNKCWTPKEDEQIALLAARGATDKEIAAALRCSITSVRARRRTLKVKPARARPWTDHDTETLKALVDISHEYHSIAESMGRSYHYIKRKCKELQLGPCRDGRESIQINQTQQTTVELLSAG